MTLQRIINFLQIADEDKKNVSWSGVFFMIVTNILLIVMFYFHLGREANTLTLLCYVVLTFTISITVCISPIRFNNLFCSIAFRVTWLSIFFFGMMEFSLYDPSVNIFGLALLASMVMSILNMIISVPFRLLSYCLGYTGVVFMKQNYWENNAPEPIKNEDPKLKYAENIVRFKYLDMNETELQVHLKNSLKEEDYTEAAIIQKYLDKL